MKLRALILSSLVFISSHAFAQEKTMEQLESDLGKINKSIDVTKEKMKEVKDVNFLPDLYFVLAELYVEKSRYEYNITRQKNEDTPLEEIDFGDSKKSKRQAIEVYLRIIETFPKGDSIDRAYFYLAHEYRELGATEDMVKTYQKIIHDYPKSQFWEEVSIILGDFFLEQKKDPKIALEYYQKVLSRPQNAFMPIARYKSGWCYINLEKFHDALLAFEGVITIDSHIPLDVMEKLPDIYKKSDVRRDALIALVWPYSEEKQLDSFHRPPLDYFERLSPTRPTLMKVLDKLAKRLMLKNRIEEVMPVYMRLLELTHNLEMRMEYVDRFYEVLRRTHKAWPLDKIPYELTNTLIRIRGSDDIPQADKTKAEKNYEIFLRDVTTKLHQTAKRTKQVADYTAAIDGYEDYLTLFPNAKYYNSILLDLAESYFAIKKYTQAGLNYERLYVRTGKKKKDTIDSAVQSYAFALKAPDKVSKLELTQAREGFRDVGSVFVRSYKADNANAMILFNIGRTYYDERDFDRAVKGFMAFINAFPQHKEATTAGNLILDSFNQREDYEGLIKAGRALIANPRMNNPQFKKDVGEIVKQAEFRKIQNAVGDPKSRDYAQKLLGFASKYQGSTLGDQALYEAFTSLKTKKDPGAYDPGEQLLQKHGDSRYAKEVVGAMGQMALNTADYRRAANYFETFARKYPKDPTSPGLLRSAAQMRELMGDYKEAADDFRDLGSAYVENIAKQFALALDWTSLSQTLAARPLGSLKGQYWMGLSLYRQGQLAQSKPYLLAASRSRGGSYEEKKMAAHSLYLLSTEALKDYQAIRLGGGQNEANLVKLKNAKLTQLTNQFNHVIAFGNGRWTIAALYQLGRSNLEFAQFINGAAMPPGLNPAQQAQYKGLISQQAEGFKQKASNYFKLCAQNAEKYEVFTGFATGCSSQGTVEVDESAEEKIKSKASDTPPTDATAIRRQLFDKSRDPKLLMDLAQSYTRAADYSMARVILNRVLEIKPNYATAEGQLGLVFLFMNDLESAQASFKLALSHNSNDQASLWGMAGLYKQFGFTSKFNSTFARARRAGKPSSALPPQVSQL